MFTGQVYDNPKLMSSIKSASLSKLKCDALHDLVAFSQFKKRGNTHGKMLVFVKLQASAYDFISYI